MTRSARVVVPDFPHHVVHRGHNRQAIFEKAADYDAYLSGLAELSAEYGTRVYAYCLMTNHVHLLLSPSSPNGLALVMKRLAGRLTRNRNCREARTGTRWEGRYHSSLVDGDAYLLACCRYIELNPVRAGMASDPAEYEWSSYRSRMGLAASSLLEPDPAFVALGRTSAERRAEYADFVLQTPPDDEWRLIREAVHRGQLTGNQAFGRAIATRLGRHLWNRGPGRPRKLDRSATRK